METRQISYDQQIQELESQLAKRNQENDFLLNTLEDISGEEQPSKLVEELCHFLKEYYDIEIDEFLHLAGDKIKSYIHPAKSYESTQFEHLLDSLDAENPLVIYRNDLPIVIFSYKNKHANDFTINNVKRLCNIVAMALENKRRLRMRIEENRYQDEIKIARKVQNMLITNSYPYAEEIQIDTIYIPHREVSGDYYDFLKIGDKRVIFCIADVSGKGVPAALLMAAFQATFRRLSVNYSSLTDLVEKMNSAVFGNTKGERFVSAFFGEYDLTSNTLKYINAGHNYPRLSMGNQLNYLIKGSTLLGIIPEFENIEEGSIVIKEDSLLLLYTDGLAEIKVNDHEIYENQELDHFILQNSELSPKNFNEKLKECILGYNDNIKDDVTVFTCRIKPEGIV